jgi:acyl-CoA synthetase (NDP forming)
VEEAIGEIIERCRAASTEIDGVVVCQYFEHGGSRSFGNELFVGIRAAREFGPVISSGIGGLHTEYFATNLRKGAAITTALAMETSAEEFFVRFQRTVAYEVLSGKARGYTRVVADDNLRECFDAFIQMARQFCTSEAKDTPTIRDLEINPFAFMDGYMVPLDGLCTFGPPPTGTPPRPIAKINRLLHPESIAVLGASSKGMNIGRVILRNVLECGFDPAAVVVVKPGMEALDGIACVDRVSDLPENVDLLVLAVGAGLVPALTTEIIAHGGIQSVIVIPGGMGETEGGKDVEAEVCQQIVEAHKAPGGGPVFVGGNCLGIQSRPGRYDTMFIPSSKLAKRWTAQGRGTALISQSGAYVITRMSNLETLDPNYAISVGNQIDLTISDLTRFLVEDGMTDVFGIYVEGFRDLDGLALCNTVADATRMGKDVIFYKAGRTTAGQQASASHTASIAGDYNVCEAAVGNAGGLVCETFKEFENLLEIASHLCGRKVGGTRIGAISNAGYETVGMADAVTGPHYAVELPAPGETTTAQLQQILERHKLQSLVTVRNPLDLTPMATDEAHEECIRAMLASPDIDAVIASFVPLTPAMKTTPDEIASVSSMTNRLPAIFRDTNKPLVVVIDSGSLYDPLAHAIREAGVPLFRSADQAVRNLGRYLCHKVRVQNEALSGPRARA